MDAILFYDYAHTSVNMHFSWHMRSLIRVFVIGSLDSISS